MLRDKRLTKKETGKIEAWYKKNNSIKNISEERKGIHHVHLAAKFFKPLR